MTAQAYKSPLGFHFTAEEEERAQRAMSAASKFFETYGKGAAPRTSFGIVRDERRYDCCRNYEKSLGSRLSTGERISEPQLIDGEWMTLNDLAEKFGYSYETVKHRLKKAGLTPRKYKAPKARQWAYLYRLSEAREVLRPKGKSPMEYADTQLTEEEYLSGKWLRPYQIPEMLGLHQSCVYGISGMLIKHGIPHKLYTEEKKPHKFYDIDLVRELPYIQRLIAKYKDELR